MKINMILPGLNHSGGTQVALKYLNYFVDKGADVVCYVPIKTLILTGITSDSLGKWFKNKFKIKFVPVVNDFTVRDADIVIATSWITSYWVANLLIRKGKKVYFIQDYETWYSETKNQKVRETYHLKMDMRISVSSALQKKLLKLDDCKSKVICNGIEESFLVKKGFIKGDGNRIVIGMPYRQEKGTSNVKNCKFGISVVKKIMQKNPNVYFKMFGFRRPKYLSKRTTFLENPSRIDLMKWYDTVDIFYVPSLYEGWGLPVMEAMARGCAVVASDSGCLNEFGINGTNCLKLQNMQSTNEAIQTMQRLINDRRMRNKVGKSALMTVENYTFEKSATMFWNELKQLSSTETFM